MGHSLMVMGHFLADEKAVWKCSSCLHQLAASTLQARVEEAI